ALRSMEPENPQRISSAAASLAAPGAAGGHASPSAASAETTLSTQKPSGDGAVPDCDETDTDDTIRICTQVPGGGMLDFEEPKHRVYFYGSDLVALAVGQKPIL